MRLTLGILVGLALFGLGIYFDITFFLIGGITEFVNGIKADPTNSGMIAVGVVKFFCAGIGAFVGGLLGFVVGKLIAGDA